MAAIIENLIRMALQDVVFVENFVKNTFIRIEGQVHIQSMSG